MIQITNENHGLVYPCGYSYWSRINNHRNQSTFKVLVGLKDHGPTIFEVDKSSEQVINSHSLFSEGSSLFANEADQWYWSANDPDIIYMANNHEFCKVHANGFNEVEVIFTPERGSFLFQTHSSDDGNTHSATVQDDNYKPIGCMVWKNGHQEFYPIQGDYDECQIDTSGDWLTIKQNNDNRFVNVNNGDWHILNNADGAVGHSDCGNGFIVGEDDMHDPPGRTVKIDLVTGDVTLVYSLTQWDSGLGHVSVRNDVAIISNAHRENLERVNDIIAVPLDGSMNWRIVAPSLVNLNASGGGSDYKKQPMANIDPVGEYVCWSSNHGSDRIDIFVVKR